MRAASSAALAGAVTVAGCAMAASRLVPAEVVAPLSKQLRISAVRVEDRTDRIVIQGRVERRSMISGAVWGHLHIEAWGAQGLLAWKDTRWTQLSKRRLPSSSFSTTLPVASAQVKQIRISHMTASHRRRAQQEPVHD